MQSPAKKVINMDTKVKQMFTEEKIDFKTLAETFPGIAEYFQGTNPGKINEYDNGVMSTVIEGQGKESPSTFGYLPAGEFVFNVGGNQFFKLFTARCFIKENILGYGFICFRESVE